MTASVLASSLLTACLSPGSDGGVSIADRPSPDEDRIENIVPTPVVSGDRPATAELSTLGVERIVPVRFHVLDTVSMRDGCTTPFNVAIAAGTLREANAMYLSAGVQFRLAGLHTYHTPRFRNLRQTSVYEWSEVWGELSAIAPGALNAGTFAGQRATAAEFLHAVATRLTENEIPVFVPCSMDAAPYSRFPWDRSSPRFWGDDSRVVVMDRASFGKPTDGGRGFKQLAFPHEVGHYLGLIHPFDLLGTIGTPWVASEDFYDLFYAIGPGNTIRNFDSPLDLMTTPRALVRMKSGDGLGTSGQAQCMPSVLDGDLSCNWNGRTYRTSTDPEALGGLGFTYEPGAVYGVNVMDYLTAPATGPRWNARASLSATQIARVRSVLRFWRPTLGAATGSMSQQRDYFGLSGFELDFSGDGLRDLAYFDWERPSCMIRSSGTGDLLEIPLPDADITLGDTPIAADFNGDGRTDCAVFRPGTGVGDAQWIFEVSSGRSPVARSLPITFGSLGDLPFANVRIKTGGAPATFGVFTPSTGTFWFRSNGTNWSVPLGNQKSHLVLADFDMDGYTDLVTWQQSRWSAGAATVSIRRSREDYAEEHSFEFGEITDLPLGPIMRRERGSNAPTFALYRPRTGDWFYLEALGYENDPHTYTEERWGQETDIPLPGYDFDRDGTSDAAVYRPASTRFGTGVLYVRGSTGVQKGFAVGRAGDVPFLAKDHNGDGSPEFYLYRPSEGTYFYLESSGFNYPTFATVPFGSNVYPPF